MPRTRLLPLVVVVLLFSLFVIIHGGKAGKVSRWQRKACLSACREEQRRPVACSRRCASKSQAKRLVTRRQAGNKTIQDSNRCKDSDLDPLMFGQTDLPSCHGAIHNPDCLAPTRRASSPSVVAAGPPTNLRLEFLTDDSDELVGSLYWTRPSRSGGDFEYDGVQIRIYTLTTNDNIPGLIALCLEIYNQDAESTCDLNSTVMKWSRSTWYTVHINSIPLPFNCSQEPTTTVERIKSPALCDNGVGNDQPVHCTKYPAPGRPTVSTKISPGRNYVNLTILWTQPNNSLPLFKTRLLVQNSSWDTVTSATLYENLTSYVCSFLPVYEGYWISVMLYPNPIKTEDQGQGLSGSNYITLPIAPAPGRPTVSTEMSRGKNYVNLTISWTQPDNGLPIFETKLLVQNSSWENVTSATLSESLTSYVCSFLPVSKSYWISVTLYTNSMMTERNGLGLPGLGYITLSETPVPTDSSTPSQAQSSSSSKIITQPFHSQYSASTAGQLPQATPSKRMTSVAIAASVAGICAIVSIIIIIGSLIYRQRVVRQSQSNDFLALPSHQNNASVLQEPFCAHTDRNELSRIVEQYRQPLNRMTNCPQSTHNSRETSKHIEPETDHETQTTDSSQTETTDSSPTIIVHYEINDFECAWFRNDITPRVLFVYSTVIPEAASECRRIVAMVRSDYGVNATSHEFDEEEARKSIPNWVDKHIERADFVVFICSRELKEDFDNRRERGFGDHQVLRSIWHFTEGFYTERRADATAKCLPVVLRQEEHVIVPSIMAMQRIYCWATEKEQIIHLLVNKESDI